MSQKTIGQRLRILIKSLDLDVKGFCQRIDVSETSIRNYFSRWNNPNAGFLTKLTITFEYVNLHWLLTGNGEPFLTDMAYNQSTTINAKKNSGNIQNNTGNAQVTNNIELAECRRDLDATRRDAAAYQREIALLQGQLKDKEEIITLLRGGYNRPN